jgi:hypothetical protein
MTPPRNYYQWIIALVAFVGFCAACYFCFKPQPQPEPVVVSTVKKEAKIITVFIHGSLCPDNSFIESISLSDLNTIFFDTIEDDSEYIQSLKRIRANPEFYGDQIMLVEGLHEVRESDIAHLSTKKQSHKTNGHHCACCHHTEHVHKETSVSQNAHGAHYAIACYSSLMKRLFPKYETSYYTFGHLGVLSHRYRAAVAKELYQELVEKVDEAKSVYEVVKVVLVTHSHGGTIAFNMATAENELKKGLKIDNLVLFGTPLQHETAPLACHPMFKRVMNCYSLGDTMQGSDILTTASRQCYKTFSSIESLTSEDNKIYDIQLVVNDDGHAVTHGNMWYMKHAVKGTGHLEPLPYAVMTPALIAALDEHKFASSIQASIRSESGHLGVEVHDVEKKKQYKSPNTHDIIATVRDRATAQITREHV